MTGAGAPLALVVGWPIAHSRSPLIHGHWLKSLGIDGSYQRRPVEPGDFTAFAATIGAGALVGANVTMPHKQAAFLACATTTDVAKSLGAVNTLWIERGALHGDNTDVEGFLANLDAETPGWDVKNGEALVLGAGGAARAICFALLARGYGRVALANRTPAHSVALIGRFDGRVAALPREPKASDVAAADLIVNTTSLGMRSQPRLFLDLAAAKSKAVVADLIYAPLETELVLAARGRGLRAVGGLGMLLHQAVPGFQRWFGVRPRVDAALRALIEADVRSAQ